MNKEKKIPTDYNCSSCWGYC